MASTALAGMPAGFTGRRYARQSGEEAVDRDLVWLARSPDYVGGWLRELTYHHLFLLARGTQGVEEGAVGQLIPRQ